MLSSTPLWLPLCLGGVHVLAGVVVGLFLGVRILLGVEEGLFLGEFRKFEPGLSTWLLLIPCIALKLCMTRWEAADMVSGFSFLAGIALDWFSRRAATGSITAFSTRDIDCVADRCSTLGVELSPRATDDDDWPFVTGIADLSTGRPITIFDLSGCCVELASTTADWLLLAEEDSDPPLPFSTGEAGNGAVCDRCFLFGISGLFDKLVLSITGVMALWWSWKSWGKGFGIASCKLGLKPFPPLLSRTDSSWTFRLFIGELLIIWPFTSGFWLVSILGSVFRDRGGVVSLFVPFLRSAKLGSPLGKLANLATVSRSSATWGANGIFRSVGCLLIGCLFLADDPWWCVRFLCLLVSSFLTIGRVSGKCLPFIELGSSSSSS